MSFTVELASTPDRESVVAEIWCDDVMVAELHRSKSGELQLDIYAEKSSTPLSLDLKSWLAAVAEAQRRLRE
jgi:hypothetical protein